MTMTIPWKPRNCCLQKWKKLKVGQNAVALRVSTSAILPCGN